MPTRDVVKTGIAGLDAILSDGIPRGNVILLEGAIGTGKTTFGVEFVYHGASRFKEPGIIRLFEVCPAKHVRCPGGCVVGWREGGSEVGTDDGGRFGEDRLAELVTKNAHRREEQIIATVIEAVKQWTGTAELQDDLTLLLVRRH